MIVDEADNDDDEFDYDDYNYNYDNHDGQCYFAMTCLTKAHSILSTTVTCCKVLSSVANRSFATRM